MATIAQVRTPLTRDNKAVKIFWETLVGTDDGAPLTPDQGSLSFPRKSVQITGTFDTTTIVIEGSNDGTNYKTLTDGDGNALSFTAAALENIYENCGHIRPNISADGGSGDLDVTLIMSK